jgi:hypothetical protein
MLSAFSGIGLRYGATVLVMPHAANARPPPSLESNVRASLGRIVDMLQQFVLVRPDMIIPLEEIMRGMLTGRPLRKS